MELKRILWPSTLVLIFYLNACASPPKMLKAKETETGQIIQVGDVLEIKSSKYPAFNQVMIVGPDGKVSLQAIGEIEVRNLTTQDFQKLLNFQYGQWLDDPSMKVYIKESSKFKVFIAGDVANPGVITFKGSLTIEQGILLAGGFKDHSTDHKVYVFRNKNLDGVQMYKIRLRKKASNNRAARKFELAPYDIIWVIKETKQPTGKKGRLI